MQGDLTDVEFDDEESSSDPDSADNNKAADVRRDGDGDRQQATMSTSRQPASEPSPLEPTAPTVSPNYPAGSSRSSNLQPGRDDNNSDKRRAQDYDAPWVK